jgi:16S rRNA (adenine1518-N6/adenine1519-N6)-dimethyltransferase
MYIKPKKGLGQNFLVDKNVQNKIIKACAFSPQDVVLEVGAGTGEFTRLIAEEAAFVCALEIDDALCEDLRKNLKKYKNVSVICQDFLKFDFNAYFLRHPGKIKVFGNIPYYITSPIIERIFESKNKIDTVFLTVQKEFAQRILARAGTKKYGSFTCFIEYFAEPKKFFYIKKNSFYPAPKVDSCFLQLSIRENPPVLLKDEKLFFKIIRAAFNQRRKTLKNSLKEVIPRKNIEDFLKMRGLDQNIRPENLSLEDFAFLVNTG